MENDSKPRTTSYESICSKAKCLRHLLSSITALIFSIGIIAVIAIIVWLISVDDSAASNLSEKKQRDLPEVVQLSLGKTQLYIPSKYLKGRKVGKNYLGQAIHINLWALLPDFDWYEPSRNHYEFVEQLGFGRRMHIRLKDREGVLPLHKFFNEGGPYSKYTYFVDGRYDELKYGLELYNNHYPSSEWYFLRNKKGEPILWGTCSKDGVYLSPGCELMWELSRDVRVRVDFNKRYLAKWQLIYSQVNRLLSPTPRFGVVSGSDIKGS